MEFTWHDTKRQKNRRKHSLDFADGASVFAGPTVTYEDTRDRNGVRFVPPGDRKAIPFDRLGRAERPPQRNLAFSPRVERAASAASLGVLIMFTLTQKRLDKRLAIGSHFLLKNSNIR